ncbi:adp-ribosylation factor-related protein [Anaeramoeba ignava]|uniref:Adp-ribosylation factor-related protein n=1 Tax=Anaeramoeba ignava TaxID=1746090 RepID=A0A9Q0L8Z2_ANAIG|nr:adp-ribosylation factor-related protein [Anaeramoeba ignava]
MFGLVQGLFSQMFKTPEYYILILGLENSGKTTLLEKIKNIYNKEEETPHNLIFPTVGLNIGRIQIGGNKFIFWDLGGEKGLRNIWKSYYSSTNAIIFVIDSSTQNIMKSTENENENKNKNKNMNIQNEKNVQNQLKEIREIFAQLMEEKDLDDIPFLVLANKQDLGNCLSPNEIEECLFDLLPIGGTFKFVAISSYTGQGMKEGIDWLIEYLVLHSLPNKKID